MKQDEAQKAAIRIAHHIKTTIAAGLRAALKRQNISHDELARRMRTSRGVVHNLLSVDTSVTLTTLSRAVHVLGATCRIRIV